MRRLPLFILIAFAICCFAFTIVLSRNLPYTPKYQPFYEEEHHKAVEQQRKFWERKMKRMKNPPRTNAPYHHPEYYQYMECIKLCVEKYKYFSKEERKMYWRCRKECGRIFEKGRDYRRRLRPPQNYWKEDTPMGASGVRG